ncbi:ATP-binding protein [Streptomyces sp. NPDC004838]
MEHGTDKRGRGPRRAGPAAGRARRVPARLLGGLRTRLLVAFVLIALVSAVTATGLAYREYRNAVLRSAQDAFAADLREQVESLAPEFDIPPDQRSLTALAGDVSDGLSGDPSVVARYQKLTAVSGPRTAASLITPELGSAVRTGDRTRLQRVEHRGEPYLVAGTPVAFDNGRDSGLDVFAVASLRTEQQEIGSLLDTVRNGVIPVLVLAALLALLAARTVLRPVRELGRATRALATGALTTRVTTRGRDELADLAQDFNTTADALQTSVGELREQEEKARRFAADVSHELRTPLAAMTMMTTVLDEDAGHLPPDAARAARGVGAETARLSRLVDDLMEMSRFDAKAARLISTEVDLVATVRSTLALRGWSETVRLHAPETVRAAVDRRRVDVIVANLVGNAVRHGAPPVTVTLTPDADGVVLEVSDHGPGLPPEVIGHVFDRFYKADTARSRSEGSGLGMSIALENARLHGGTIEAANRPGGGALFTLRLPGTVRGSRP